VTVAAQCLQAGARIVQLRMKRTPVAEAEQAARDVRECTTATEVEAVLEQRFAARLSSEPPPA
jgi:thiamine monophosphate synthase